MYSITIFCIIECYLVSVTYQKTTSTEHSALFTKSNSNFHGTWCFINFKRLLVHPQRTFSHSNMALPPHSNYSSYLLSLQFPWNSFPSRSLLWILMLSSWVQLQLLFPNLRRRRFKVSNSSRWIFCYTMAFQSSSSNHFPQLLRECSIFQI